MEKVDWPKDKNGEVIEPGKRVKCPTGHLADIVFENCALRFRVDGWKNLDKNGSLVFCERWTPCDFEVVPCYKENL